MRYCLFYSCADVFWDVKADSYAGIDGPFGDKAYFMPGVGEVWK